PVRATADRAHRKCLRTRPRIYLKARTTRRTPLTSASATTTSAGCCAGPPSAENVVKVPLVPPPIAPPLNVATDPMPLEPQDHDTPPRPSMRIGTDAFSR